MTLAPMKVIMQKQRMKAIMNLITRMNWKGTVMKKPRTAHILSWVVSYHDGSTSSWQQQCQATYHQKPVMSVKKEIPTSKTPKNHATLFANLALPSITRTCYFAMTMDAIALSCWFEFMKDDNVIVFSRCKNAK